MPVKSPNKAVAKAPEKTPVKTAVKAPRPAVKAPAKSVAASAVKIPVKAVSGVAAKPAAAKPGMTDKKAVAAAVKSAPKVAPKVATQVAPKATPKAVEAPREKAKKPKLVRDSFTMPEAEYQVLVDLKKACIKSGFDVKKSELLRVGVAMMQQADVAKLKQILATLPALKAGRPRKAR